ncbi:hypothetical protein OG909_08495 [Streptomyces sp. NBC_01754]|uniref:hypothetical protein n=1 Tax=Streptomyces sp. NBC_01754 TaxID=2975930 RepID=UPI002DD9C9E9|nr:hypothetical protein [Streptomyces sp. NBC_01754]WSC92330.1 hypothetical protein OG909_08495 [Streptomyces sp. NBC_01754]
MDKKWLPLAITLGVAGVAVVTATVWSDNVEEQPLPQSLCHGALSRKTAELIDDGQGGVVSTDEWEGKGRSTNYVFKECAVWRVNPGEIYARDLFGLTIEGNPMPSERKEGAVPLGPGFTGWALPDQATATLPDGCAAGMGWNTPYIRVRLSVKSQDEDRLARLEQEPPVDPDIATRNNATVVREAVTRLAKRYNCTP